MFYKNKKKPLYIEDEECKVFIFQLNYVKYKKPCLIYKNCNDIRNNNNPFFGAQLIKLGKRAGIPDYSVMWADGCGFIEFKRKKTEGRAKGYLSKEQKEIQQECIEKNIKFEVVYSSEEAMDVLHKWGLIA